MNIMQILEQILVINVIRIVITVMDHQHKIVRVANQENSIKVQLAFYIVAESFMEILILIIVKPVMLIV